MLCSRAVLGLTLLGASMVVPGYRAVNDGSVGDSSKQWSDGSPMPIPKPAGGGLVADGSPMPVPRPPGLVEQAA